MSDPAPVNDRVNEPDTNAVDADAVVARVVSLLGGALPPRTSANVDAGGHLRFVVRNRLLACAGCGMSVPQTPGRADEEALARWVRDHLACAPSDEPLLQVDGDDSPGG